MVRFGFSPGSRQSRKDRIEQAKKEAEAEKSRRRNFGFLKNADMRLSTTTLSKTREHAKELAMAWDEPLETPTSTSSAQVLLRTDEPFDPFGHSTNTSADPQSFQFSFSNKRTVTNGSGSLLDQNFTSAASPEPTASTLDTFDTASVGSAFDMDFFSGKPSHQLPPASAPKPKKSLSHFVEREKSPGPGPGNYSGTSIDGSAARSMPTFPTNSSMQSSFAKQSTSTAASRRKMRSQMRNSSNNSVTSSQADEASDHSGMVTPPESPARSTMNGVSGSAAKNRLTAYQRPQTGSFYSAGSSAGNNSNQSSSNRSGSEVDLFDSQHLNGGFTFDAFGLDQAQVEKDVNDAMHALAGQGMPGFSVFFNNDTDGDFSSQGWDSPAASRRSSPAPSDSEIDGFVDGFRISPTRHRGVSSSPASSERSFSSPASRHMVRAHAHDTITPPRWEESPDQGSRHVFGEPVSNPWKEDPWGSEDEGKYFSDSGADSDFGGTRSEVVAPRYQTQSQFEARFPDSRSDIGTSSYQKSVSFHKDVRTPRQTPASNFGDESSEDSDTMKEDIAREYALEFVRRISPRHTHQESVSQGDRTTHGKELHGKVPHSSSHHSTADPFAFEGDFDSGFGDAQEEMFQAEFGFPGPASDFVDDHAGFGDFGVASPSRSIPENLGRRFDAHDDRVIGPLTSKPAARASKNSSDAPQSTAPQFNSVRTRYEGSRGASKAPDENDLASFEPRSTPKPQSSYGKLRNSYEAAKSRLSIERAEPLPAQSVASEDFASSRSNGDEAALSEALSSRIEEKKEDESTRRGGRTIARNLDRQAWENKPNQVVSPEPAQPAPKWKMNNKTAQHSALSGVEMLTPDIVEARRQEKRKSRVEELRQANQEASGVLQRANAYERSVAVSSQRANECQVERSSYASLRERLKPTAASKPKSDVGADYMSSFASNVVDRLRQESPRAAAGSETKSDVGSSPSYLASVRLQKTGSILSESAGRSTLDGVNVDSPSIRAKDSFRPSDEHHNVSTIRSPKAAESDAVEVPIERKLTYRERRELELKKEQGGKATLEAVKNDEPKKDVAALIRKRIASNKQKNAVSPTVDSGSSQSSHLRSNLKPITAPDDSLDRQSLQQEKKGNLPPSPTKGSAHSRYLSRFEPSDPPKGFRNTHLVSDVSSNDEEVPLGSPRVENFLSASTARNFGHAKDSLLPSTPAPHKGFRNAHLVSDVDRNDEEDPLGSPRVENFLSASTARNVGYPNGSLLPSTAAPLGSKSPTAPSSLRDAKDMELGEARYATSNRLEALLSKKKEEPKDFSVHSATSAPQPVNKPAFEPPADGAAGKNDVKAMLSGLLGARMNPFASLPAPKKEDDADAIMELKSFESKHSPEKNISQNPPPPLPPNAVTNGKRPALKDDPKYERYFRMLKVGMPMEVVKHAMQKDGTDPSVMDGDHNLPVGLPLKDDPQYTKYFKMLKMGISMPQVKHSMERDGLNPNVMDQDHNLPASASEKGSNDEPLEKDTKRRARLHWKTLQKVNRNSLWSKIEKEPEVSNIDFDEDEFEELFQADLAPSVKSPKGIGATRKKGAAVRVIDAKRANNGGIILARVKMSHDQMADVVDRIDGDALTAEQIENIIEYLPTKEERVQLEKYMLEGGQDAAEKFDGLCECEKFMVSMMTVKHAKRKVNALLFKLQFISCLQSIAEDTQLIDDACDELKHSTRLRQLLGIVLQFGNRLNTAGKSRQSKAGAFTLDSLLKLSQAKAFDKKTTFLHYVVMIVHRNNEILLNFTDDLPTCLRADKIYWDQCLQDLEEVENQLENVRRISLYEAIARNHNLGNRKKKDDDDDSIGGLDLSLEEEVDALRATPTGLFTLSAVKQVSALRDKVEATRKKFVRVLEYFGEDNDSMQPHELFNIFCVFGRDFNKAKEEAFASMKKKQREERKQAGRTQQPRPTNGMKGKPPSVPERKTLRASNFQPNMGKVINDLRGPAKQTKPQQRPEMPHRNTSSQPKFQQDAHNSQQASHTPDLKRSPRSPANEPLQQQRDYHHSNTEVSRVPPAPPNASSAYRRHVPQSMIPDSPVPRGMQETAHFRDASTPSSGFSQSVPAQATSAAESLRQKAINRGQHMQVAIARTTPIASNKSVAESRSPQSSPMTRPEYSSSSHDELNVGSPATLSSRASMRHRRMQAIKRVNAAKNQPRNDWGASSQVSTY